MMQSAVVEAWATLAAKLRELGDTTIADLAPGRPAEEIASTVQSTVGLPATQELVEWLALHDGPASGGSAQLCATGIWLTSFDRLLRTYADKRQLAEEIGPDVGGPDEIWPTYFFPIGLRQAWTIGYDLSPSPVAQSWRVRSVFQQELASESPGIDTVADLVQSIIDLIDSGAYVWSSGQWQRRAERVPETLARLRML